MKKRLNARGIKETLYETITPGEKDYSALVSKLKQAGIDVLYSELRCLPASAAVDEAHSGAAGTSSTPSIEVEAVLLGCGFPASVQPELAAAVIPVPSGCGCGWRPDGALSCLTPRGVPRHERPGAAGSGAERPQLSRHPWLIRLLAAVQERNAAHVRAAVGVGQAAGAAAAAQ